MWNLLVVLVCLAPASGLPFGNIFNSAASSFSNIGNDVGKTFQNGAKSISSGAQSVGDAAGQAGHGMVDAASAVGNGINQAGKSVVDATKTVGESLTDSAPLNFLKDLFAWVAEWIMPLLFGLAVMASVIAVLCFLCYAKSICDMFSVCFCCCKTFSCLSSRTNNRKHNHVHCKTRNMFLLPKNGSK